MAQVEGLSLQIDVEGWDEVIKDIQKITDDIIKRREIYKILGRQAEPVRRAIRDEAPIRTMGEKSTRLFVKYHRDSSTVFRRGNLKKSIKKFRNKNKMFPTIYVGAQVKKAKGSGYYGFFNQYGTAQGGPGPKNARNFVAIAAQKSSDYIMGKASDQLVKYLKGKYSKKFDVGHGTLGNV